MAPHLIRFLRHAAREDSESTAFERALAQGVLEALEALKRIPHEEPQGSELSDA